MAGSDMDNEFEQLWRSLIRIKYKLPAMKDSSELPKENLREKLCQGDTAALLPIISYSLLVYSKRLSHYLIEKGYKIYGQSDTRFTDEVYKLVRNEFNYNPTLQSSQFLTVDGYAKSKLQFVNVILENAIKKAMKLKKEEKRAAMRKKSWHETELSKKIEDDLAKQKEEKKLKQEKEKEKEKEKTIKSKKQQNKGYQRSLKHLKSKSNTNTGNTTTNTTNSHANTSGNSTKQNSLSNSDSNSLKDENETARNNSSSMSATNAAVAAARQRIANMFNDKGEAKMPGARATVGGMGGMGNVGARHDGSSFCEIRKELPIPIGNEKTKNEKTMSKDNNNNNNNENENDNNNVKMPMSPRLHNTMIENEEKASEISDSELFGNGNGNANGVTRGGTRMTKEPRHIKVDLDEALMVDFNDDNNDDDDDSNRNGKDKESDHKSYGQEEEEEENSVESAKAKLEKRKKENENKSGLNVTSRMLLSSSYDPNDYDHSGLDATMETFHTRFNHLKSKSDKYDDFDSFYHGIDDSLFDGNHKNSEKKYANFAFSNENSNKNKSNNNSNSNNKNNNDTIVSMMSTIPENDEKSGVTGSMASMTADDHKTENQSEKKTSTNNNNNNSNKNDENSEQKDKNESGEQTGQNTNGETMKPNADTNTNTNTNSHSNWNNNNNKDNENENENGIVGITRHDYGYSDNFLFSSSRFDKHMNEDDDDDDDIGGIGGIGGIGSSTKEMKQDNDDDCDLTVFGTKIDINSHNDDIMGTSNNHSNNVNDLGVYGSGIGGGIGGMNSPLYGSSRISGIGSGLGGIGGGISGIDSGASSRFLNRHNSISRGIGGIGSGSLMGGIGGIGSRSTASTTRTFGVGDTYMTSEATQLMLATIVSRLDNLETTIKDYAERTDARLTIMEGKIEFLENNKYQNENNQATKTKTRKENDSEQLKFEETDMLKSKTTLQDALKKESMTSNNYRSGLSGNSNSCQFDEMKEYKSNNDSDHAHSNNSNNTLITNMNVDSTVVSIPDFHFNDNINTTKAKATTTATATATTTTSSSSSRNQHESGTRNGNSSKERESTIGSTPPVSSLTPGNKENSSDTVGSNSIEKTNNKENINNESQTKMTNNRNMIENKTRASIGENKKNPSNTTSNSKGNNNNNNNNVGSKYDYSSLGLNYGLAFNTLKENVNTLNSSNNENNSSSSALWVSSLKPPQSPLLQKNGENSNNNRWTSNSRHIMSGYQSYSNTNDVPLHFMEFPLGSSSSSNNSFNHSNTNNNNGSSGTNSNRHHSNHNESNNSGDSFEYDETVEFIKSLTQQMDATNRFLLRDPKTGENSSK